MGKPPGSSTDTKSRPAYLSKEEQVKLALAAKDGDNDAWGKLYSSFHKALLGFIAGKTGNIHDAEDLCQNIFMTARKNLMDGKYDPVYSFYSFLRNITSFALKKYWEGSTRETVRDFSSDDESETKDAAKSLPDPGRGPEAVLERLEMLRLMILCCAKPHQIIAVEFVKLLRWKPQEVVRELSNRTLGYLSKKFFDDYLESFGGLIPKRNFYRYSSDQFIKILNRTEDVYAEAEYTDKLEDYKRIKVRELTFQLFYTAKKEASLHDWCDKVKNRMRNALQKGILCREDL